MTRSSSCGGRGDLTDIRKKLRLKEYDYSTPGWYSVTVCIRERKKLLGCVVGADVLIGPKVSLMEPGRVVEKVLSSMPAVERFVIMPDHVHMILRIDPVENGPIGISAPTPSVPGLIRYFKSSVTRMWGHSLWQRSYYDHIIRDEADYLRLWNYIVTNPDRWLERNSKKL